ncbi:MAG: hypothetical protein RLZZ237_2812 [Pseudomonadota bacterium]
MIDDQRKPDYLARACGKPSSGGLDGKAAYVAGRFSMWKYREING